MAPAGALIMSDEAYVARHGGQMAPVEITGGEPHVVGGHGLSGYWVDVARRTTLPGLWAAGDVAGGSPKKYASGAWAEAVLAVRDMIERVRDAPEPQVERTAIERERARALAPLHHGSGPPPHELEERLQKIMDEYAGGIGSQYGYSEGELNLARLHLQRLRHDLDHIAAASPFELMQAHDVIGRAGRTHAASARDALALLPGASGLPSARRCTLDGVRQ
jgi:adenylylsulfate reductase, subunit A